MPYYRRLPSGLWQATVRGRDGKRHSRTDRLKAVVKQWAAEQEAAIARGEFRDPRLGEIKVAGWHARVVRARGIEDITKAKNASLWRTHCEPELVGVAGFEPAASSSRTSGAAGRLAGTQLARCAGGRACWRLSGDVAVIPCCTLCRPRTSGLSVALGQPTPGITGRAAGSRCGMTTPPVPEPTPPAPIPPDPVPPAADPAPPPGPHPDPPVPTPEPPDPTPPWPSGADSSE
jgi:hypothetical protein